MKNRLLTPARGVWSYQYQVEFVNVRLVANWIIKYIFFLRVLATVLLWFTQGHTIPKNGGMFRRTIRYREISWEGVVLGFFFCPPPFLRRNMLRIIFSPIAEFRQYSGGSFDRWVLKSRPARNSSDSSSKCHNHVLYHWESWFVIADSHLTFSALVQKVPKQYRLGTAHTHTHTLQSGQVFP